MIRKFPNLYKCIDKGHRNFCLRFAYIVDGIIYATDGVVLIKLDLRIYFTETEIAILNGKAIGYKDLVLLSKAKDVELREDGDFCYLVIDNGKEKVVRFFSGVFFNVIADGKYRFSYLDSITSASLTYVKSVFIKGYSTEVTESYLIMPDFNSVFPIKGTEEGIEGVNINYKKLSALCECFVGYPTPKLHFYGHAKPIVVEPVVEPDVEEWATGGMLQIGLIMPFVHP